MKIETGHLRRKPVTVQEVMYWLVGRPGGVLFLVLCALQTYIRAFVLHCLLLAFVIADQQERHNDLEVFSVSPANGILEAREGEQPTKDMLQITFTARYS